MSGDINTATFTPVAIDKHIVEPHGDRKIVTTSPCDVFSYSWIPTTTGTFEVRTR